MNARFAPQASRRLPNSRLENTIEHNMDSTTQASAVPTYQVDEKISGCSRASRL